MRAMRRLGGTLLGRCDDAVCYVVTGPGTLLNRVRALLPERRPIHKLRLCEEGTIKVKSTDEGARQLYLIPHKHGADHCQLEDFDF